MMLILLYFSGIFYVKFMDISGGQSVMQKISQEQTANVSNDAAIKEVLKLVTLSGLLQENYCEIWSHCNVSVDFL